MLLIPMLLAIGALAVLATRHQAAAPTQLTHASGAPSPILVLDQFLRVGQTPPTFVIACAIAQAEALGRMDLSRALVDAFVRPIVAEADAAEAMRVLHARDANPPPWAMPMLGPHGALPPMASFPAPTSEQGHPGHHHAHRHVARGADGPGDAWALDWAPDWSPGGGAHTSPASPASPGSTSPGPVGIPSIADPAYGTRVEIVERPGGVDPAAGRARGASSAAPNDGTITVSGMNSPIVDVSNEAWGNFASRVSRQLPTFSTARHVGQFRQSRDRLVKLGFDPDSVAGSPELQRQAFTADMADAYQHASESGLLAEYRGAVMEIPTPDAGAVPIEVTVSGVMGVIQAAGLEGAVAWLERPEDRRRFPNTTAAFLRSNGAF